MKYYLLCLLILFLFGGVVLAEEKSSDENCYPIFSTSIHEKYGNCLNLRFWVGIENSNSVVKGSSAVGEETESIFSESAENKWDINLGFEKQKLTSVIDFFSPENTITNPEKYGFTHKLIRGVEFDAYFTYGRNYEFRNMPNTDVLNTTSAVRSNNFRRNFEVRFNVPLF